MGFHDVRITVDNFGNENPAVLELISYRSDPVPEHLFERVPDSGYIILFNDRDAIGQELYRSSSGVLTNSANVAGVGTTFLDYFNSLSIDLDGVEHSMSSDFVFGSKSIILSDIKAIAVAFDPRADTLVPLRNPFSNEPPASTTSIEGGSIPIQSILALRGSEIGVEPGTRHKSDEQIASMLSDPPSSLHSTTNQTTTVVAGERARAIVFELAGGDPVRSDRPAFHFDPGSSTPAATLHQSGGDPIRETSASPQAASDRPAPDVAEAVDGRIIYDNWLTRPVNLPKSDYGIAPERASHFSRIRRFNERFSEISAHSLAAEMISAVDAAHVAGASPISASAHSAAMELFGENEAHGQPPMIDRRWWPQSFNPMPLLILWALERVAASSSRRKMNQDPVCLLKQSRNPTLVRNH